LNNHQIQAVAYIREHGKITNSEFQILASIKKRQATKDLNDLKRTSGYFPGWEDRKRDSLYFKKGHQRGIKGSKGAPKGHKGCEVFKKNSRSDFLHAIFENFDPLASGRVRQVIIKLRGDSSLLDLSNEEMAKA
jgi:hypothetical protein